MLNRELKYMSLSKSKGHFNLGIFLSIPILQTTVASKAVGDFFQLKFGMLLMEL